MRPTPGERADGETDRHACDACDACEDELEMSANAAGRFGLYFAGRHDSSRCRSITMMKRITPDYDERPLSDGYPGLTQLAVRGTSARTNQPSRSPSRRLNALVG